MNCGYSNSTTRRNTWLFYVVRIRIARHSISSSSLADDKRHLCHEVKLIRRLYLSTYIRYDWVYDQTRVSQWKHNWKVFIKDSELKLTAVDDLQAKEKQTKIKTKSNKTTCEEVVTNIVDRNKRENFHQNSSLRFLRRVGTVSDRQTAFEDRSPRLICKCVQLTSCRFEPSNSRKSRRQTDRVYCTSYQRISSTDRNVQRQADHETRQLR